MLAFLPAPLRGAIAVSLLLLNTLWWCLWLFALALLRLLLVPVPGARRVLDPLLNAVASAWIAGNSGWMALTQPMRWSVQGLEGFDPRGWYLLVSNHQSWADIFVLQHLFNRRIPMLKFFLKRELMWVPVMGLAWWALDFPFMRRHGEAVLRAHPEKRLDDLRATRRACQRFATVPTSVTNFVEGTRFTATKHAAQRSPYRHLLRPKAGGLAMAMSVLGPQFHSLVDVTIVYPDGVPGFWAFMCGQASRVTVRVQTLPIPESLSIAAEADGATDEHQRKQVQQWLTELWQRKDEAIATLLRDAGQPEAVAR